jgi:hypothetical protein
MVKMEKKSEEEILEDLVNIAISEYDRIRETKKRQNNPNTTQIKNRDYKNVSAEHREKTSKSMKKAWEKGFHRDQSHMKRDSRGRWKQFEQGD